MSYGIWKKRGSGWSSIEIDSPGNRETLFDLQYDNKTRYNSLVSGLDKHDVDWDSQSDHNQLTWELNQKKRHPRRTTVEYCPGDGEHVRWIAFDSGAALEAALIADDASADDFAQCGLKKV